MRNLQRTLMCITLLSIAAGCVKKNTSTVLFDPNDANARRNLSSVFKDDTVANNTESGNNSIIAARRAFQIALNEAVSDQAEAGNLNDRRLLGRRKVISVLNSSQGNPAKMSDTEVAALAKAINEANPNLTPVEEGGSWDVVDQSFRSQAIHMIVYPRKENETDPDNLPPVNVNVMIVNGSSNRDGLTVPKGPGVQNEVQRPEDVENNGIFDPEKNTYVNITQTAIGQSFPTENYDAKSDPIDLFCGNHLQTYRGDILFLGGTNNYLSGGAFIGNDILWLFNWRKNRFEVAARNSNAMRDRRWYATPIPDADGNIHLMGGVVVGDAGDVAISRILEVFDPVTRTLDWYPKNNDQLAIQNINRSIAALGGQWHMYHRVIARRKGIQNGTDKGSFVFTNDGVGYGNLANNNTILVDLHKNANEGYFPVFDMAGPQKDTTSKFYPASIYDPRMPYSGQPETFDHYLTIGGQQGSDMLERDNDGNGQHPMSQVTRYFPGRFEEKGNKGGFSTQDQFLGRTLAEIDNVTEGNANAKAQANTDRRINHVAVYLPTGDFMVLGGGARGYQYPAFDALLYRDQRDPMPHEWKEPLEGVGLTERPPRILPGVKADGPWRRDRLQPGGAFGDFNGFASLGCAFGDVNAPAVGDEDKNQTNGQDDMQGFCLKRMNPHRFPHLYHTTAVLLQDGRVLLGGGNAQRAQWDNGDPKPGESAEQILETREDLMLNNFQGSGGGREKFTSLVNPAENHFLEIFNPPYMFALNRPEITDLATKVITYGDTVTFTVEGAALPPQGSARVTFIKLGSITHGMDTGARFWATEQITYPAAGDKRTVSLQFPDDSWANILPPGYYYLSFVDVRRMVPTKKSALIQVQPRRVANKSVTEVE